MRQYSNFTLAFVLGAFASPALASEGGGTPYPNGAEALGIAQLPPPGTYLINYAMYYDADRLNGEQGERVAPDFRLHAAVDVARFVHVSPTKIFGATWAQQVFVPIGNVDVRVGGQRQQKFGLGDIIIDPIVLGWKIGDTNVALGLDTFVPVGRYSRQDLANIGRNYWTFEPVVAVTHVSPRGFEASMKLMYDFNTKNKATGYRSGQEFHADFGAAANIGKWSVGATAFIDRQTTSDTIDAVRVGTNGNKGSAFGIGPVIRYSVGKVPITFQWQHETSARNRPQGDRLWLKANFRL